MCFLYCVCCYVQVKEAPRAPSPPPPPKVEVGQSMIGGEVKRDPLNLIKVRKLDCSTAQYSAMCLSATRVSSS
jgi:hypothetical protein